MSVQLEVRNLAKRFPVGGAFHRAQLHAVDDVSFALRPGTITALVGESGSGSRSPVRSRSSRRSCSPTSPRACSTSRSGSGSST